LLSYEDCLALCELTEEEVEAISEHEHLPEIVAAEYGNYLIHQPNGVPAIRRIILDDIEAARARGDVKHALALRLVLRHFVQRHPQHRARGKGSSFPGAARGAAQKDPKGASQEADEEPE